MLINNETKIMGIIGNPVDHSLSPLMHNRTLDRLGLNYVYLPFLVVPGRLGEAVLGLRALNMVGANVTTPYKGAVIEYLDGLSAEARACGAVNLIKNENGKLVGYNTDGKGFMASLEEEEIIHINNALIIGAGGAARSLVYELAISGVSQINILDMERDKASELARFVSKVHRSSATGALMSDDLFSNLSQNADLIVNCTPVGMLPHVDRSPVVSLHKAQHTAVVYDLIYNPFTTAFLSMARARRLKTMNGLSMLVHQGALTLRILTGAEAPIGFMKEVVLNSFKKQ